MRAIAIVTFVALVGAWSSACCDCAKAIEEKEGQVAGLEAKVKELERAAAEKPAEESAAAKPPAEAAPANLDSCIERLKACELDPFKGGKYFTPEKVDPKAAGGGDKDLKDPFKGKPKPEPKKGDLMDPFAGK
ncbi:MAG: hypothetical protein JRF63_01290 [Deltaproteobacteria bacterium]|nr:hypothetical protein [Deltaproteobacteria bacterium]